MDGMTRNEATYQWLRNYVTTHGYPPTRRELAASLGLGLSTVQYRLDRLEALGWVKREPGRGRAMRLMRDETLKIQR